VTAVFVLSFFVTFNSNAAITGSVHDFSNDSWNPSGEICIVCHTPHNATSTIAPLWNHRLTSATYTTYSSPSLTASVGQPSASSKACLSCHDGTIGLDAYGGRPGTTFMTGDENLGTDLSNDHPISFTYDATLATADGGLHNPTVKTVASLGGKTIANGMLIGNKLECGSCHDVHNNKGDAPNTSRLLVVNNANSALCLTCHNK
jgi:hypothetical protein